MRNFHVIRSIMSSLFTIAGSEFVLFYRIGLEWRRFIRILCAAAIKGLCSDVSGDRCKTPKWAEAL